ncbi:MAG: iron(III) transport system permease protein [Acetobacteraceae bacterium]|jgi:iron(III) transport system permease protein|nr:iron(III) transport system permease protein [Acetobacteraceae bacterium]
MSATIARSRGLAAEPGVLVLAALTVCALFVFVVYPAVRVLATPGWDEALDVLARPRTWQAARHSLVITVLSTTSSTLIGFAFAFVATRRDMPFRDLFRVVGLMPLFAPPFMVAFAYILMFGRQGLLTNHLLGLDVNIFGWQGLWLSQTIAFFPLSTAIIQGVLEGVHPNAEQAALTLGATESAALRTILLPLAWPGVIGAMLVVAITVLADFGNAVVIAGNYPLLATEAWFMMDGLGDLQGAAVIVSILLVPTIGLFIASRALLNKREFTASGGRGAAVDQIATPPFIKWSAVAICSATSLLVLTLYAAILIAGLTRQWGSDWSFTFRHWADTASHMDAVGTSLLIGALAGLVTAGVGQIAAFVHSRPIPLRGLVGLLAVLPGALPGVFIGVGFLLAFNAPPLELADSIWLIVLALGFWHLPQAYQSTSAALGQIHRSIEDSARDLGASELRLIVDVYAPLLSRNLLAAFLQCFIRSVSNISVIVFLISPGQVLVTYVILQMISGSDWSGAAALTTVLLAITFCCVGLLQAALHWIGPATRGSQA